MYLNIAIYNYNIFCCFFLFVCVQVFDKIKHGSVNWSQVNKPPFKRMSGNMKKLDNCFYVIEVAREHGFSLSFINAHSIAKGSKTAILCKNNSFGLG